MRRQAASHWFATSLVLTLFAPSPAYAQTAYPDERYATLGLVTAHSTPEQVTEMIRTESPAMGKVLRAAGVEPE